MNPTVSSHDHLDQPEFMAVLGLLPPYTENDVHLAYLEKAKIAHPDHGGQPGEFQKLHEAFEAAMHYVEHRTDKHSWIAAQVTRYVEQNHAVEQLKSLGAELDLEVIDWLRKSFGDFAELTEKLVGVRLADSTHGGEVVDCLVTNRKAFSGLQRLELRRCSLSDQAVARLVAFDSLKQLDLSGNPLSSRSAALLKSLPALEELVIGGTKIGWFARRKLRPVLVESLG